MPSPFPGMDPYLEGPHWQNFHHQLCAEIARQLIPKLRPKYVAVTAERFVMAPPDSIAITSAGTIPDVSVVPTGAKPGPSGAGAGAVAVMEPSLRVQTAMPEPIPHVTVEVRHVADWELVAAIEVLSPTNKRGVGHEEYLEKRQRVLLSRAHLLEIDLLG